MPLVQPPTPSDPNNYLSRPPLFISPLLRYDGGNLAMVSNTAYFVYVGPTAQACTIQSVTFQVGSAGSGTQAGEFCFASTPLPPNRSAQTMTVLGATTATASIFTSTGVKTQTVSWSVSAGIQLYIGVRVQMATTQPQLVAAGLDFGQSAVLTKATAGVLAAGSYTGLSQVSATGTTTAPFMIGNIV